eukprot:CAMPEP_0174282492 /NCGR_PEP_ID=MMETSP0809-20121228/3014_1 /TAXON_ID=73025 ORGANISM="Eutreptiella gymnastica-like, Strain CCMP1594" /NCGR_SAMPLE_ID=MMETSP0809 /ASSEMBLY_ACC=CAM_ASM_000658 /LENGTH=505 /DNA_ID=CAMNT_0015376745 /DNA_START=43 /DNA_END=1560 /DNA_ORIENTATION=+
MTRHCASSQTRAVAVSVGQQFLNKSAVVQFLRPKDPLPKDIPLESSDFSAEKGQVFVHNNGPQSDHYRTVLVGLPEKPVAADLADATQAVVAKLKSIKQPSADVILPSLDELQVQDAAHVISLISCLSDYKFDQFLSKGRDLKIENLHLVAGSDMGTDQVQGVQGSVSKGTILGNAVNWCRDLGNARSDISTPSYYQKQAEELCNLHSSLSMKVLQQDDLLAEGMHLLNEVGKGADDKPRLVIMEYKGSTGDLPPPLALVGKGITFDTGGLNLKPTGGIETMYMDMNGAATVLGAMKAIAELQLPCHVVAALALAENAIGPNALKPEAVVTSMKGLTVEISNTDAEGRLVLADAMTYVQRNYKPHTLLDFATLTGAMIISLGEHFCGYFCNSDELAQQIDKAATATDDKSWRMPLHANYLADIKGSVADLRNRQPQAGQPPGAACTAAAFLEEFVEDGVRWAHFDLAGSSVASAARGYRPKGATGYGVQLVAQYAQDTLCDSKAA